MSEESSQPDEAAAADAASAGDARKALPEVDFSNFVLSLAASAMMQLGLMPDPEGGEALPPNVLMARHTIDTLAMIQEKTRGNLSDEEEKLLESMLFELRMRVVEPGS